MVAEVKTNRRRPFRVIVTTRCSECWIVFAESAEHAREIYQNGDLDGIAELDAQVEEVEEA
jgi:hypothetical protein